ncbi:MAG: FprA family A-type flavoprotein [Oscillospiraceae bacterium]
MSSTIISDKVKYIGCNDKTLDLFENQYKIPEGVSYNSYVILDDKIAVMDTADHRVSEEWFNNLAAALDGRTPDYLIVSHLEPDHSANIGAAMDKYPEMKLVCSAKAAGMLGQFFDTDFAGRVITVKEGEALSLGEHILQFYMAPMVHWPEVMVEYEQTEKILFSADGFGKFGALDVDDEWDCEARRYYFNIVGKYGAPVQTLLKKAASLDIKTICPLHGPILTGDLSHYIDRYNTWSSYAPEEKGVFIPYASLHGNTKEAAEKLAEMITAKGVKAVLCDLSRDDLAEAVEDAFRYDRMVCAASTYDGGIFTPMADFIGRLKSKTYQNRTVAFIENGSWAPMSAKLMKAEFETMKNITFIDTTVTIKTSVKPAVIADLEKLADEMTK